MFTTWSTYTAFWAAIALQGSPACPTVDAVITALDSLAAEGSEPAGSAHVELLEEVGVVRVTRRSAFGVIEAEKGV